MTTGALTSTLMFKKNDIYRILGPIETSTTCLKVWVICFNIDETPRRFDSVNVNDGKEH